MTRTKNDPFCFFTRSVQSTRSFHETRRRRGLPSSKHVLPIPLKTTVTTTSVINLLALVVSCLLRRGFRFQPVSIGGGNE